MVAAYPNQRRNRCIPQRLGRCLSNQRRNRCIYPSQPHHRMRIDVVVVFLRHAHGQHMLQRRIHNHGSKRTWHAQFRVYWHLARWRRSRSPRHPSYRHEFRLKRIVEPAVAGVSKLSANIYLERAAMQPVRVDIEADPPQYVSLLPHEVVVSYKRRATFGPRMTTVLARIADSPDSWVAAQCNMPWRPSLEDEFVAPNLLKRLRSAVMHVEKNDVHDSNKRACNNARRGEMQLRAGRRPNFVHRNGHRTWRRPITL